MDFNFLFFYFWDKGLTSNSSSILLTIFWFFPVFVSFCFWYWVLNDFGYSRSPNTLFPVGWRVYQLTFTSVSFLPFRYFYLHKIKHLPLDRNNSCFHNIYHNRPYIAVIEYYHKQLHNCLCLLTNSGFVRNFKLYNYNFRLFLLQISTSYFWIRMKLQTLYLYHYVHKFFMRL